MNVELLRNEIDLIKDSALKAEVERILETIPECMEHKPSSSTGKYHPDFDNVDGGNINHTKAVVVVAQLLINELSDWDYSQYRIVPDFIIAACILHDMCKYGQNPETAKYTVSNHPILAGNLIREKYPEVAFLIDSHMGKWNQIKENREIIGYLPMPITYMQHIVHTADAIAAQKWVSDKILDYDLGSKG